MIIGAVREIKPGEQRVGLTPEGAADLIGAGHTVLVETGAGEDAGFPDAAYRAANAQVVPDPAAVWAHADLISKVKEPQPAEFPHLRAGQILFTYLHLPAAPTVADALLASGVTAIAYETVERTDGALPLLAPMSEIAGRMAIDVAQQHLRRPGPGRGLLLGGVPGVPPAHVLVLGGGSVGRAAVRAAVGAGARVTVIASRRETLQRLDDAYAGRIETALSTPATIRRILPGVDVLVGAVHVPGSRTPVLVDRAGVRSMGPGAVIVDVAVDQGGCVETTRPTTHADPIYVEEGVVHYAVANMPGAAPRTAARALAGVTLPYILRLAQDGLEATLRALPELARGVNVHRGRVTHPAVAAALQREYTPLERV